MELLEPLPVLPWEPIVIAPLGDVQAGSSGTDWDHLARHIDKALSLNAYFIGTGDYCLPDRARILTKRGFLHHQEVLVGENVLAFNSTTKQSEWTPLRAVRITGNLPMIKMESRSFEALSSRGHHWLVDNQYVGKRPRTLIATEQLISSDRIQITAKAEGGIHPLSAREAAILGWIVTDGFIRTVPSLSVNIAQSKPKYVEELRQLLGQDYTKEYRHAKLSTFHLRTKFARALLAKAGFEGKADLVRLVTELSADAREAMLDAMIKAEGDGIREFSQKPGPVLDAFIILATLEGRRLGRLKQRPWGVTTVDVLSRQRVDVANLRFQEQGSEPSWCPTTDFGTWVAELDGQVMLTGNSDFLSPSNRRALMMAGLYDTAMELIEKWCGQHVQQLMDVLAPTKGRWLNLVEGHHYYTFGRNDTTDTRLAKFLDTRFAGSSSLTRLNFKSDQLQRAVDCRIFTAHGTGKGFSFLERIRPGFPTVDVFVMGHNCEIQHKLVAGIEFYGRPGKLKMRNRDQHLVLAGSFFRGYAEGSTLGEFGRPMGSYVERAGLQPLPIGGQFITITPQAKADYSVCEITVEG